MSKKSILAIGAVLLLVGVGAVCYFYSTDTNTSDTSAITSDGTSLPPDSVMPDDHVMGSANAPLTIIEYFAQGCSVCSSFDQNVFPLLKANYIDTGKVRYVMRLYPLFPIDAPSYKLDMCVPSGEFFQSADLLFRYQPQWDSAEYPVADSHAGLLKMARIMGMDPAQADACMNSTKYDVNINKVYKDAIARYQIDTTGTPSFVIDFKKADISFDPRDPQGSWKKLQAVLDTALAAKSAK